MASLRVRKVGKATDVLSFLRIVLSIREEPGGTWVFRGQRNAKWDPVPAIDRSEYARYRNGKWTRDEHERWLLKEFQRGARPHVQVEPQNVWEWMALAQHHALATRLLDWTSNPLGALYFSVEDPMGRTDSAVWCYRHSGKSSVSRPDPFCIPEVTAYWPSHITPRITVQGGCFTAHPPTIGGRAVPWPGVLEKVLIPRQSRAGLRKQMSRLGITRASLFPDLDGIAAATNVRYSKERRTR